MSRRRPFLPTTVLALGLVSFFTDLGSEMIYPLLPVFLTATLGASAVALGAVEGAAESTAALLKLASGWWSDRVERRKPLVVAGYVLASVVRPLVAVASSATQVLGIRVADRVGKGIRSSPRDALITEAVDPAVRGRAFGFHRAADHAGAFAGPLVAFALLRGAGLDMRTVFLVAAVPGALAVAAVVFGVREGGRREVETATTGAPAPISEPPSQSGPGRAGGAPLETRLGGRFWAFLAILFVFTLGNSTDAFLLLRAVRLGVAPDLLPILWALLHLVKASLSTPAGMLSDRLGRRGPMLAGWSLYALVYVGFAFASTGWQVWALFAVYGLYFALTEGVERALVADLSGGAGEGRRGAAFGWYHLAIGVGALPASLLFGAVWERWGAGVAFGMGAGLALVAAAGLVVVVGPGAGRGRSPLRTPRASRGR